MKIWPQSHWRLFSPTVAIDPGTANTLIYTRERGVVLNQPSVVCFEKSPRSLKHDAIAAIGMDAKATLGRSNGHVIAVQPLSHGIVAHHAAAERMIRHFLDISRVRSSLSKRCYLTVCVPSDANAVELEAIRAIAEAAGASDVCLISKALAAAIGAGLPVGEAVGSLVVDVGGGTTEAAVTSLGQVVCHQTAKIGGDQFDAAIVNYVRRQYGTWIGNQTAERLKLSIGQNIDSETSQSLCAVGHGLQAGLPTKIALSRSEISNAISGSIDTVINVVRSVLSKTPPELISDIANNGVMLTGGGALLADIGNRLGKEIGLKVRIAADPMTCAVRGAGRARIWRMR